MATGTEHIVYVPGSPDCNGVFSNYCGWTGWGGAPYDGEVLAGDPGPGSEGVGGGGSSIDVDDNSKGKQNQENRLSPGCYREQAYYAETVSNAVAGNPPGIVIMNGPFLDPAYSGNDWVKYQNERVYRETNYGSGSGRIIEWRTQMHYMYNTLTHEVSQAKFKNSFEYGCTGIYVVS